MKQIESTDWWCVKGKQMDQIVVGSTVFKTCKPDRTDLSEKNSVRMTSGHLSSGLGG